MYDAYICKYVYLHQVSINFAIGSCETVRHENPRISEYLHRTSHTNLETSKRFVRTTDLIGRKEKLQVLQICLFQKMKNAKAEDWSDEDGK